MAEPTTTTFIGVGAAAALLGPVLGPYALIVFGAVAGSLLAMGKVSTATWREGAWFVLVGVLLATAITGAVAWALEAYLHIPSSIALMPVSAAIGAGRNALLSLIESLFSTLAALVSRKGAEK